MSLNHITQHSSHLWISDPQTLEQKVIVNLQQTLCKDNNCSSCVTCTQIADKSHPWITWFEPENSYTLEQIDQIITSVQFLLDKQEQRFLIFTKANDLSSACCNRLLKTIEEPHPGYHFIFLTNRPDSILQTLKSRCIQQQFNSEKTQHSYQEILDVLYELKFKNPIHFMKLIDKLQIKDHETKEILDLLLEYFSKKLKSSLEKQSNTSLYLSILTCIKQHLKIPPLSGSHKIFWKNFYIQLHQQCLQN